MARIKIENIERNPELDARLRQKLIGGSLVSPVALLGSSRKGSRAGVAGRVGLSLFRLLLA